MMMKKLILATFILFIINVSAQTFFPLGSDASGDHILTGPDIDSLYYAIDISQDSLWFKITTHDILTDFGFYIFIDSDENPTNGFNIDEPMSPIAHPSPNTSMKMDNRFIFVTRQGATEQSWTESWSASGGAFSSSTSFYTPNNSTIIINAILSDVDQLDGNGSFNVIATSGEPFFGRTIDYIPDNTSFNVQLATTAANLKNEMRLANIYPNPNLGKFVIELNSTTSNTLFITELTGKIIHQEILTPDNKKQEINTNNLKKGLYLITINDQEGKTIYINKMSIIE